MSKKLNPFLKISNIKYKSIAASIKKGNTEERSYKTERKLMAPDELFRVIKDLESQMKLSARNLEFEKAAMLRDEILEIRQLLALEKANR